MSSKKNPSKSPRETGGPVVKTGPTRGQNRSRNNSGEWRKKRSDSGSKKDTSGCFLTTAACEHKGLSDNCYELNVLRHFRDNTLLSTRTGRSLVNQYYRVAPSIVRALTDESDLDYVWSVVRDCVKAIEDGRYVEAIYMYQSMTMCLRLKLGVAMERIELVAVDEQWIKSVQERADASRLVTFAGHICF